MYINVMNDKRQMTVDRQWGEWSECSYFFWKKYVFWCYLVLCVHY